MTEKKRVGKWKPGVSGNPKGKTPGSGELQKLRATLAADVPGRRGHVAQHDRGRASERDERQHGRRQDDDFGDAPPGAGLRLQAF